MSASTYAANKSVILQEYLSRAPELTGGTFESASEVANKLAGGNYCSWFACFFGASAGIFAGLALRSAMSERSEELDEIQNTLEEIANSCKEI